MNAMEIKNMMCEMADKPLTTNDTVVMDYIMHVYCQTAEIDHEEIRFRAIFIAVGKSKIPFFR